MVSQRLDVCTILGFGSFPNHTALELFVLNPYQPWNCMFRRGSFVDLPVACIMRFSLLFRSIGRKAATADGLCISIAVAVQRKQPALPMRMPPHIAFSSRDRAEGRRRCRYLQVTPSMKLLSTLIEAKLSDGEVHGVQGISNAFTSTLCYTAEVCPDPSEYPT
ncbi:hypothetical protein N431DRAFT_117821 [Stipitochalara longipes BDJ]|nr:hypothetical protein N431DRAFT_117821 [Stipitochalara longipes BDJ]